jgi:hypothetical protein
MIFRTKLFRFQGGRLSLIVCRSRGLFLLVNVNGPVTSITWFSPSLRAGSDPAIELVLLPSSALLCAQSVELFLRHCGLLDFGVHASAFSLVFQPPRVALPRGPVHRALHEPKEWRLASAWPIALPDVGTVAFYFIVECVIDRDFIIAMVVHCIRKQLKPDAMSGTIVTS